MKFDISLQNKKLLDKKKCNVLLCNFSDIQHILLKYHYKKNHMGGGISNCFAMTISNKLVGGSVLGKPRHEKKYKNCIDIRRMACTDDAPFNSESYFLGNIINFIKRNTEYEHILSYSDKTQGHNGTIYKASNFIQIGETDSTKYIIWDGEIYHQRSLTIERDYSYKLRDAIKNGNAKIVTGLPKIIWMYNIKRNKKYIPIVYNYYTKYYNKTLTLF